jgi:hypothetical protein
MCRGSESIEIHRIDGSTDRRIDGWRERPGRGGKHHLIHAVYRVRSAEKPAGTRESVRPKRIDGWRAHMALRKKISILSASAACSHSPSAPALA